MTDETRTLKHEKSGKTFKVRSLKASEFFDIMNIFGSGQNGDMIKEMIKRMVVEPKLTEENFDELVPLEVATALSTEVGKLIKGGGVSFL